MYFFWNEDIDGESMMLGHFSRISFHTKGAWYIKDRSNRVWLCKWGRNLFRMRVLYVWNTRSSWYILSKLLKQYLARDSLRIFSMFRILVWMNERAVCANGSLFVMILIILFCALTNGMRCVGKVFAQMELQYFKT